MQDLTPQQIKRQERNRRYRLRLAEKNVSTLPKRVKSVSRKIKKIDTSKKNIIPITLSVLISALLVYFQTKSYLDDAMPLWLSLSISIICEISICYFSASFMKNKISSLLFISLFVYSLGTMSYGLIREADRLEAQSLLQEKKNNMIISSIEKKQTQIRPVENIVKESDLLKITASVYLIRFQSFWFIFLRAILMLINATLIHRLWRKE